MRDTVKVFRSFRDAARELANISVEDAYTYIMSILDYGLDGTEPVCTGAAAACFMLARPNLDASIKKAEAGSKGGSTTQAQTEQAQAPLKQTASKPQTNASKPQAEEGSRKKEVGSRIEEVGDIPPKAPKGAKRSDAEFEIFWNAYPTKVGKQPARKAFDKVKVPVETLVAAIERQKCSSQWSKDGGQYIPNPATWLNQGRWTDELPEKPETQQERCRRELDADEISALQRMLAEEKAPLLRDNGP